MNGLPTILDLTSHAVLLQSLQAIPVWKLPRCPLQPFGEHLSSGLSQNTSIARGLRTKANGIDVCLRQFGGMTDQPALNSRTSLHFRVKLKPENVVPDSKTLRRTKRC